MVDLAAAKECRCDGCGLVIPNGLIKPDFKPNDTAIMNIINTIYENTAGIVNSSREKNTHEKFTKSDGKKIDAEFMHNAIGGRYAENDDYVISSIPFEGGADFYVLLPKKGRDLACLAKSRCKGDQRYCKS